MIQKFEIQAVHTLADEKLKAYVRRKLGRLDRYISRQNRVSAHLEVHLKETAQKGSDRYRCEVTLHLPHQNIVVKENAINMYAAVDIVEAKLKQQLQKYKERHASGKMHRRLFARFRRRT